MKLVIAIVLGFILGEITTDYLLVSIIPYIISGPVKLIVSIVIGYYIYKHLTKESDGQKQSRSLFSDIANNMKYVSEHSKSETGIAINPETEKIILKKKELTKEYSFSDVRSWESNYVNPTSGMYVTGGLSAASQNLLQNKINQSQTNLTIRVKDIENPEWKIYFKNPAQDLPKWMEIMQQYVNGN